VPFRTVDQKPTSEDFAKARELIEARGTGSLSLQDRRVVNLLYKNAGTCLCDDVDHVISIKELRGTHKGGERVKDSIIRLQTTLVRVPTVDKNGKPATKRVAILSDTATTDDEDDPNGQVVYSFSRGMREIIKDSTLWGRVRTAVVFAFTSKYSVSLYELVTARINLEHVWEEEFSLRDIRALLGVPEDKLLRMPDLLRNCINVAVAEVNGMADFGVKVEPVRKGGKLRGKATGFRVSWWRKNAQQLQEAYKEIKQSKVGRIARLTGKVEKMADYVPKLEAATATQQLAENRQKLEEQVNAEVADMLEGMRAKERTKLAAE
jgi:hypothetical protein